MKLMHIGAALAGLVMAVSTAQAQSITGTGATFPAPVYSKWAADYKAATGRTVNYQSTGSGAGIAQARSRTVDFGGTDSPLGAGELDDARMIQFPTVVGGVVPVINLAGVGAGRLRFDGPTLAGIFEGTIKTWNDPRIVALNPGVNLPSANIVLVRRSDGSGTTFIWTSYLSRHNNSFDGTVGVGTSVRWPQSLGGRGNEGVAQLVRQTPNSIGYVEFSYARRNNIPWALVRNAAGAFPAPGDASFAAAAASAGWSQANGFRAVLVNQGGAGTWPIVGATFILIPREYDAARVQNIIQFFDWAYKNGDRSALALDYVPVPDSVSNAVRAMWRATWPSAQF